MTKVIARAASVVSMAALWGSLGAGVGAQEPTAASGAGLASGRPVRVELAISRHKDNKLISRVPYMLTMNASDRPDATQTARIRIGVEMLGRPAAPGTDGKPSIGGLALGTNIDCRAQAMADGRFRVDFTVDESSLYGEGDKARPLPAVDVPVTRSFRMSDMVILRDGQTQQATSATDRFSGEVVTVDISVSVLK